MKKDERTKKAIQPNYLLSQARRDKCLSQREVADILGLDDPRSVRRWESGEATPRSYYLRKLVEIFGKSPSELGFFLADSANTQDNKNLPSDRDKKIQTDANIKRGNYPSWFTSFIGRSTEIASVHELLVRPGIRLVTILGPGGVGKTRLAVEVGKACQLDFPDGTCLISLATLRDPIFVLPTIARELQIQEKSEEPLLKTLQNFLEHKRFLFILDNFEHVLAATSLLEELISACPDLKILVTSQVVLHLPAEQQFTLEPFPLPEQESPPDDLLQFHVIQLFIQRTQAHIATFQATPENLKLINDICTCLDGLPLSIEMAASRVKLLGLSTLLQELSHKRLRVLKNGLPTSLVHHQTLTETIAWNYNCLNEQEQWFFCHLALFTGGCSLSAARELYELSPFQTSNVMDILGSLLDKSMLRPGVQKGDMLFFSMLETIREYGIEILHQRNEWNAACRIQADYYLALLTEAENLLKGAQQGIWLTRLDYERANLRATLVWLIEHQETEQALFFCEILGKYYGLRGYWGEELYWLEAVLSLPSTASAARLRGRVLRRTGYILYRFRNLERALLFFEESAAISESCDDLLNLGGAFNGLAWVHYRQGNLSIAEHFFQKSVATNRLSGDRWSLANALESLGRFAYAQGNVSEAALYIEESISLARLIEDRESLVRQLSAGVLIKNGQKFFEEAEALGYESLSYALALGNKPLTGIALRNLADTAYAQNNLEKAKDLDERRLQLARELDDRPTIAQIQLNLSHIALKQQNLEQAVALAQESLLFFQNRGDKPNTAAALRILEEIRSQSRTSSF